MSFVEHYTARQKDAVVHAYLDSHVRPAKRVVELAAAGQLQYGDEPVEPFEVNESTVRSLAAQARRRRRGEINSNLANAGASDAVEALRKRLVNAADHGIAALERRQRRERGATDWEAMRQCVRVVRELAALPQPGARGVQPGQRGPDGTRVGGASRGALAGSLLAAHRSSPPSLNGASAGPAPPPNPEDPDAEPDDVVAAYRERFGQAAEHN